METPTRGLERHGSSSSAPTTPQGSIPMEHGQQEVQPGISLGRTWSKLPEDLSQRDRLQVTYALQWLHTIQKPKDQLPRVTILRNSRKFPGEDKETRERTKPPSTRGGKVRPYDPEAVKFGKRSTQEPEVVVNHCRISSPINKNITPTQIEHKVFRPESNLNSDALWLQMSQYSEHTQKQFAEA
ncbi:hypothetical protein O181_130542 [Austropuccinia psidii MF-1]|uniref:Uncharacterized protein n=1 Tax=Austropuccinia psidii MF-1 TaxID=1389203 RepID=A0A9Q3QCK4_9BASI|nr:hypothetical protein [Austropuccinia psidii MF-1]